MEQFYKKKSVYRKIFRFIEQTIRFIEIFFKRFRFVGQFLNKFRFIEKIFQICCVCRKSFKNVWFIEELLKQFSVQRAIF